MTQDELQQIIDKLESQVSKYNASFGIFQHGGGSDESYIKANKEGLVLYALELLKAVNKTGEASGHGQNNIPLSFEEPWLDEQSDTVVQYIEPVANRSIGIDTKGRKGSVLVKFLSCGCFTVIVLLIVSAFVGLWTLIKWVF